MLFLYVKEKLKLLLKLVILYYLISFVKAIMLTTFNN